LRKHVKKRKSFPLRGEKASRKGPPLSKSKREGRQGQTYFYTEKKRFPTLRNVVTCGKINQKKRGGRYFLRGKEGPKIVQRGKKEKEM